MAANTTVQATTASHSSGSDRGEDGEVSGIAQRESGYRVHAEREGDAPECDLVGRPAVSALVSSDLGGDQTRDEPGGEGPEAH
jgi:hypothetical protein